MCENKDREFIGLLEECSDLKLIGYINGKEVSFELDKMAKFMIIGYLSKKKILQE